MNATEKKAHDAAIKRFEKAWLINHGFPPRTFPYEKMTTEEIDQYTAEENAEIEAKKPLTKDGLGDTMATDSTE